MTQVPTNARFEALQLLVKLFTKNTKLDFSSNPSPFTKELCFGLCRYYFRLSCIADLLLGTRPKEIDLWLLILLGLYQLQYLDKPEYASIKSTVELAKIIKKPWAKGLINAVLRRFCREKQTLLTALAHSDAYLSNHPLWFVEHLKKDWPTFWQSILNANDQHPPMILRVNRRKRTRADYLQQLKENAIAALPLSQTDDAIILSSPCRIQELPGFTFGEVSVQDGSAQLAATLLELKPNLHLLDLCAAPGGKVSHILEREQALAECLALDIDAKRSQLLEENLKRLHLNASIKIADARNLESWWNGQLFDRILIDAPCTGTGVIRRHPDIKVLRTEEDMINLVKLQRELLSKIWSLLRPGGIMLYATCSVLKEENEMQIENFLSTHADAALLPTAIHWGIDTGFGTQLFPGQNDCDGFFYSLLLRKES